MQDINKVTSILDENLKNESIENESFDNNQNDDGKKKKRRANLFSIYNYVNISKKCLSGVIVALCLALFIALIVYVTLLM